MTSPNLDFRCVCTFLIPRLQFFVFRRRFIFLTRHFVVVACQNWVFACSPFRLVVGTKRGRATVFLFLSLVASVLFQSRTLALSLSPPVRFFASSAACRSGRCLEITSFRHVSDTRWRARARAAQLCTLHYFFFFLPGCFRLHDAAVLGVQIPRLSLRQFRSLCFCSYYLVFVRR